MTVLFTRKRLVLIKEESTYGSDSSPTPAANAIDVKNIRLNAVANIFERDIVRGNLSPLQPIISKKWWDFSFEVELKGSGTAGTAGKIGDILEACGFSETVSAGSSVVYKPSSGVIKSVTAYVYDLPESGASCVLRKITGLRLNPRIVIEAGNICRVELSGRGKYNAPTDVSLPSGAVFEETLPPIVQSAQFTFGTGNNLIVQSLTIDIANELTDIDNLNAAEGFDGIRITRRNPNGTFNPEAILAADYDFWTDWHSSTARQLTLTIGSEAGNKITITCPKITIDSIADGDRGGILTKDIPFHCSQDAGNDEIVLKFE